jgi:hypothetical protein
VKERERERERERSGMFIESDRAKNNFQIGGGEG